ncbi:MAG: anaerobic ribonucleoside-triphosphate reductase activating protein [Oscillospiraceae bacterium]
MLICGLQKLTLLDFPGKLAATVFTGGCNLRCGFCHNASLVTRASEAAPIPQAEVLAFLKTRVGKLDGVCVTGGEPLLQPDLADFLRAVRALGFAVKLDTNGCFPERLAALLDEKLLDYVAMDIKNSPEKYPQTVGIADFDVTPVLESAALIKAAGIPYEFRTTLVGTLHELADMDGIGRIIAGAPVYYLQNFENSGDLVGFGTQAETDALGGFSAEALCRFRDAALPYAGRVEIRN